MKKIILMGTISLLILIAATALRCWMAFVQQFLPKPK